MHIHYNVYIKTESNIFFISVDIFLIEEKKLHQNRYLIDIQSDWGGYGIVENYHVFFKHIVYSVMKKAAEMSKK